MHLLSAAAATMVEVVTMSDRPDRESMADEVFVLHPLSFKRWLESIVGCDCDNGKRSEPDPGQSGYSAWLEDDGTRQSWPCRRCVVVEAGGIRVRVRLGLLVRAEPDSVADYRKYGGVIVPAVEVADE